MSKHDRISLLYHFHRLLNEVANPINLLLNFLSSLLFSSHLTNKQTNPLSLSLLYSRIAILFALKFDKHLASTQLNSLLNGRKMVAFELIL